MNGLNNPGWLKKYMNTYSCIDEIPDTLYNAINLKLDRLTSEQPEVSIIISVWNEEVDLLSTIRSLVDSTTSVPVEFIVVNNNSTDRTQEVLEKLHVKTFIQTIQGCGPARQLGLEQAKGKYILTADADCIYPEGWIDGMLAALKSPDVVCVYGRYSFIGNKITPRWKLSIYEKMKDVIAVVRHQHRPFLNSLGMTMGFVRLYALKVGYIMENLRGEDGMLTLSLMQFGSVIPVKEDRYKIWTGTRTIIKNKGLFNAVFLRIVEGLLNITTYLKKPAVYDKSTAEQYKKSLKSSKRNTLII
ncbi:glycosyltransferase family 2 protein [Mucilaginibacter sp.]|uniref:glycosyltransferase family 2 protein n=1 Tax=Mucilaginibacter sp. TaxID=1882438 RepID=UPI003D0C63DB